MGMKAFTGRAIFFSFTDSSLFLHGLATCYLLARKCHHRFFLRVSLNALLEADCSASSSRKSYVDANGCFFPIKLFFFLFVLDSLIAFALRHNSQYQLSLFSLQFSLLWCKEKVIFFVYSFHIQTVFKYINTSWYYLLLCYTISTLYKLFFAQ